MMNDRHLKKVPYFFLFALSFYPLMKAGIASVTAILFLATTLIFYRENFRKRVKAYGYKPFLVNCGFYLFLLLSITYSDDMLGGLKKIQASLLLLFFPPIVIYFLPKIKERIFEYFSYGFILANLIVLLYFFDTLVEGLRIDRFPELANKGFVAQLSAINTYPYEFVLSKAHKHLEVIYESHKVYVSLHFLVAILLSYRLMLRPAIWKASKILLGIFIVIFGLAIIYSQALTTVLALGLVVVLFPFLHLKGYVKKSVYLVSLVLLFGLGKASGLFDTYANKNTSSVFKLLESVFDSKEVEKDADKRIYVYDCSIDLIMQHPLLGHGVGDVQQKLNACYDQRNYVVAQHRSVGSEINSHNYYLNIWLSAGIFGLIALLFLFGHNIFLAVKSRNYVYLFFLIALGLSLLTENILVRMAGVFLFAIFNTLFYSISTIDVRRKQ